MCIKNVEYILCAHKYARTFLMHICDAHFKYTFIPKSAQNAASSSLWSHMRQIE